MRCSANDAQFLFVEVTLEPVGVDDLFALLWRHRPQILHSGTHHPLAVRRKLAELTVELPRLVFLLGRQVLPSLHAVEHAQLLLRRQT